MLDYSARVLEAYLLTTGGGWWDNEGAISGCVGAWQAKGAPDYATSLTDLSGNGNNLSEGNGSVSWASGSGWSFTAASSQYFDTGLTPVSGWSMLCQFANVSNDGAVVGQFSLSDARFYIFPRRDGGIIYGSGGARTVSPTLSSGNAGVAGQQGFRNGVADGLAIGAWGGPGNVPIYIGVIAHETVTTFGFVTGDIYAVSIYNATLSAVEMLAVATAMAAL